MIASGNEKSARGDMVCCHGIENDTSVELCKAHRADGPPEGFENGIFVFVRIEGGGIGAVGDWPEWVKQNHTPKLSSLH
jgi:hypothetical protein